MSRQNKKTAAATPAADPATALAAELAPELDAAARHDAEWHPTDGGPARPNELPMALVALAQLGAPAARRAAFADAYATRLHAMPPAEPWVSGEPWPDALGEPKHWPKLRSLFDDWWGHEGADLLVPVLARLLQAPASAGFEGLLRTAAALEARNPAEVTRALAYWACRWQPLTAPQAAAPRRRAVAADAADPRAAAVATLDALARAAGERYAARGDDAARRVMLAAAGLPILLARVDEPAAAVSCFAEAARALLGRAPRRAPVATASAAPRWDVLARRAVARDDAALVRTVAAARALHRRQPSPVWAAVALRALGPG